jgi:hypothetical protein
VRRSTVIGWGAVAAIAGAVTTAVEAVLAAMYPEATLPKVLMGVGMALLGLGLIGFHALQERAYGALGRSGLYLSLAGIAAQVVADSARVAGSDALELLGLVGFLLTVVGLTLYGAATIRGRVLPRWSGIAFIVALPMWVTLAVSSQAMGWGDAGAAAGGVIFGLIWLALGGALWSRRSPTAETSPRAA